MKDRKRIMRLTGVTLAAVLAFGTAVPISAYAKEYTAREIDIGTTVVQPGDTLKSTRCSGLGNVGMSITIRDWYIEFGQHSNDITYNLTGSGSFPSYDYVVQNASGITGGHYPNIPEGYEFCGWKIIETSGVCSEGRDCIDSGHSTSMKLQIMIRTKDEETGDTETEDSKTEDSKTEGSGTGRVEQTPEQKWAKSADNPVNYAVSIKDATGKEIRSVLPSQSKCKDETKAIVTQKLEEAEKAFEKSDSGNQIVITMTDSQCGPELKKLLEVKAAEQGATLGSIYEMKVVERTKKEYAFVRDINKVDGEGVTYTIGLPQKVKDASAGGKVVDVIWYDSEGGIHVLKDLDADIATVTVKINRPSGTFSFLIR